MGLLIISVMMLFMHCTTQLEPRGVQMSASAHVLCLTTHTHVQVFQVHSGTPRIPEVSGVVQEFGSKSGTGA